MAWTTTISIHAPLRGRPDARTAEIFPGNFNPRPLAGATGGFLGHDVSATISIHAPLRGRLHDIQILPQVRRNFNPRPLAGATNQGHNGGGAVPFQSTPPCGGDRPLYAGVFYLLHFNPRPLAGATPGRNPKNDPGFISIHAPLRGRRPLHKSAVCSFDFNPRPLAGATRWQVTRAPLLSRFQSTPPCGGDGQETVDGLTLEISIHAPLRGRLTVSGDSMVNADFNPRPLAGATAIRWRHRDFRQISIHAPLRGRPEEGFNFTAVKKFQSTPPCGGDGVGQDPPRGKEISIHAPLRGRLFRAGTSNLPAHFNPRPLAGATSGTFLCSGLGQFQSTPPCGGDCQTGQLEFYKRFRLFSRKSVHGSPKPHFPVLVPSVCFPFALTAPWELLGHRSFWLPGAGFCSDTCFPGCRTASCRGLCR